MEGYLKILVFELNKQPFAFDLQQVLSIEKNLSVTEIPGTSSFMKGITDLRGVMTPVIDLKDRLHIGKTVETNEIRILIVTLDGLQIGLTVDSAKDVLDIDYTSIKPAPEIIAGVDELFLKGIVKLDNEIIVLLDLQRILKFEKLDGVQEVI